MAETKVTRSNGSNEMFWYHGGLALYREWYKGAYILKAKSVMVSVNKHKVNGLATCSYQPNQTVIPLYRD